MIGVVVPIPIAPVEVIVTFAVSLGPIIVDPAILLIILLPNADDPDEDTVLAKPNAEVK